MSNLEVFKQQNKHVINHINRYEPTIIEFLNKLENKNLINKNYPREVRTNLKKFGIIGNAAMTLANRSDIKKKLYYLVAICNAYQVNSELLRKHLLIVVNWDEFTNLNKSNATLGTLLSRLSNKGLEETDFINHLSKSKNIRNSIAHCTFFYEDNQIHFYKNIYDNSPIKMDLESFREESIKLNILTAELLIIYFDMHPPKI